MWKKFLKAFDINPFELLLKKAKAQNKKKILIFWNRGLGDIALGLYAMVYRITQCIEEAEITFLTRPDLYEGFVLLSKVNILIAPSLKRGAQVSVTELLSQLQIDPKNFDWIIANPDPTWWVSWQRGNLTPKLHWQSQWDLLYQKFSLSKEEGYIGVHVQPETNYAKWRDWPLPYWEKLFCKLTSQGKKVVLFGFSQEPLFPIDGVIDLRGKTTLLEVLSIVKGVCRALIVPDSGISSMVYFLKEDFPLTHISLWANPDMGILKQNVASPNRLLTHIPLISPTKDLKDILPDQVYERLSSF